MKSNAKILLQSIACLFLCTILFSLIFSILYFFHMINTNAFHILNWIFGAAAYLIAGFILGMGIQKKALLHALGVIAIIAVIGCLLLESFTLMVIIKLVSKLLCYTVGCAFALSRKV
ncbi:MAG: DUF3792 domain-containing protein [Erysipelotrichaceae bacterium]|nr:DUF3792 domain-containing protein [Erysipelotrichaceae bacterium]